VTGAVGWLQGDVALITGGGSGLGRALVGRFLEEGAQVVVLEKSPEKVDDLRSTYGDKVLVVRGDATSISDNRRAVADAVAEFGRLDTFIANAAIWDFSMRLVDIPDNALAEAFDEVFHLNVLGYLMGARAAVHELAKTRGSLILTLSNAAFYPGGGGPLYTASKHAGVGIVRQLAYEFAPKVRVNGVAPGGILSDLRGPRSLDLDSRTMPTRSFSAAVERLTPLQRMPSAEDYTGHYVLLASRANASTATGAIINCDGGIGVRGLASAAGGEDL